MSYKNQQLHEQNTLLKVWISVVMLHGIVIAMLFYLNKSSFELKKNFLMMASVIDFESTKLAPVVEKSKFKEKKQTEEKRVSSESMESSQDFEKKSEGKQGSAPVSMPNADASDLNNPKPYYPSISRKLGEQGKVLLKACVNEVGGLDSVLIAQSSGYDRLDNVAKETVQKWRFVPAKKNGTPVSMCYHLPVNFILEK